MKVGRYEIRGEIARGGVGVVFRAWDPQAQREVAIKVLRNADAPLYERKRFQREVTAFARLRHPNIVAALEAGEHAGRAYLVMELVEGATLKEVLRRGPLPPVQAIRLTQKLALALQHAHEHNVLHRDVKPENVILDPSGEPRLTDFGLTGDRDLSPSGTRLSLSGNFMGTPGYWSPEQALGEVDAIGPTTDVYGLGATLYALLTGFPPQADAFTLLEAVQNATAEPHPPSAVWPELDKGLDVICMRCMARRPADRYPTPGAVGEALAHYKPSALQAQGSPKRRQLGPIAVSLFAVTVAVGLWWSRGAPPIPSSPSVAEAESTPAASEPGRQRAEGTPRRVDSEATVEAPSPASEIDSGDAEAHYKRGASRFAQGDYQGAFEDFTRVIEVDPGMASAYYNRGNTRVGLEDLQGAIEDFTRAIEIDPDDADSYNNRGNLRLRQGDPKGAIADYTQTIEIKPDARAYNNRGRARAQVSDHGGAIEDYTQAIQFEPEHAWAYTNRGSSRAELGDQEGAVEDHTRAIKIDPEHAWAYSNRGNAHFHLGDFATATSDLRRGLDLLPLDDPSRGWVETGLAEARRRLAESRGEQD